METDKKSWRADRGSFLKNMSPSTILKLRCFIIHVFSLRPRLNATFDIAVSFLSFFSTLERNVLRWGNRWRKKGNLGEEEDKLARFATESRGENKVGGSA